MVKWRAWGSSARLILPFSSTRTGRKFDPAHQRCRWQIPTRNALLAQVLKKILQLIMFCMFGSLSGERGETPLVINGTDFCTGAGCR
jgi:hypothetical protein